MANKFIEWYQKAFRFVTYDMWHVDMDHYSKRDAFFVRQLKIVTITIRRFIEDKVTIRCSALSYYTLMAIVPILALLFAIAKGFGISEILRESLNQRFEGYTEAIDFLMQFADNALANAKTGVLSILGIVFLLWSVIKVLNNVESAFNDIWQVKRGRPMSRKVTDYSAFILIVPLLLAFSSTISLSLRYHVGSLTENIPILQQVGPLFGTFAPFLLMYIVLTFVYVAVPYTKVRIVPALIAAVLAGTAFQLTQNLYIFSQITVSKYSAIYGAFAAVPLLCLWLQVSFMIVLFGAELSFAYQNLERYHYEATSGHLSPFLRKVSAIAVARLIAKHFLEGGNPYTINELTEKLDLPNRVIRNSVEDLQQSHILSEVLIGGKRKTKDNAYQPAIDVHLLTIAYVYQSIDRMGQSTIAEDEDEDIVQIIKILSGIFTDFEKTEGSKLLIEI